jgi:single-strand DNA-binding protein
MADSTATIVGNATRDPELKFTNTGIAVASFGVAVNDRKFNKATNEWEDDPSFFEVTCWKELAENVAETVARGTRVVVVGRLKWRQWENKDGETRSKVEIVADEVGPGLRWATAVVTRRSKNDDGGGRGGGRSSSRSSGGRSGGSRQAPREEPEFGEEPF